MKRLRLDRPLLATLGGLALLLGLGTWSLRPAPELAVLEQAQTLAQAGRYAEAITLTEPIPVDARHYADVQQARQQWQQALAQQQRALAQQRAQQQAAERARQQAQQLTKIATDLAKIVYSDYSPAEFAPYQLSLARAKLTLKVGKPGRYGPQPSSDNLKLITLALANELDRLLPVELRRELRQVDFNFWNRHLASLPIKMVGSQNGLAALNSIRLKKL